MLNWIAGFVVVLIIAAFFWPQGKLPSEPNTTPERLAKQQNTSSQIINRSNSFSKVNDNERAQSFRDTEKFDQNIRALLKQAQILFDQKNYTQPKSHNALKVYQDVLKFLSSDIAIWHEDKKRSDILGQADQAFKSGNYIAPATKNALYFYEKMLTTEPKNQRALNGIQKIINVYANKTKNAIAANQISDATTSLEILNEIDPSYPLIPSLRSKIQQAKDNP